MHFSDAKDCSSLNIRSYILIFLGVPGCNFYWLYVLVNGFYLINDAWSVDLVVRNDFCRQYSVFKKMQALNRFHLKKKKRKIVRKMFFFLYLPLHHRQWTTITTTIVLKRIRFVCVQNIVNKYGVNGLFRGLTMTVVREMPSYFCFFGVYEAVREALKPVGQTRDECGLVATTVAGAAGGILLWTVTFPVDVVKTRIQLDDALPTRNWTACVARVYRDEGFAALYSGLAPTLVRCVPSSAVLFLVFEYTKKWLS